MAFVSSGTPNRLEASLRRFLVRNEGRSVAVVDHLNYAVKGEIRGYQGLSGAIGWGVFYDGYLGPQTAFFRLSTAQPSGGFTLNPKVVVLVGAPKRDWWHSEGQPFLVAPFSLAVFRQGGTE